MGVDLANRSTYQVVGRQFRVTLTGPERSFSAVSCDPNKSQKVIGSL